MRTIRERRPRQVHIELDVRRFEALKDPEAWRRTDIVQVLREKKQHLFLLQLYLANMQARIGQETGSEPGAEMMAAVQAADEVGSEVVLIDRDVAITLKRGFGSMGFWARLRLFWNVWLEVFTPAAAEDPKPLDVEAMLETDAITQMTQEFARFAPDVKVALIDERDAYMAGKIQAARVQGHSVVAVVGAGHLPGLLRHLREPASIPDAATLEALPPKRVGLGAILGWGIPLLVVAAFVYLGVTGRFQELWDGVGSWILITGGFAALGAALALAHPLSILTAFVAAPITTLHPLLAAGWFAGLTEAKVRTPTVADFQAIKRITTFRGFWTNAVVRILLVTALANLGAMVGMSIAAWRFWPVVWDFLQAAWDFVADLLARLLPGAAGVFP